MNRILLLLTFCSLYLVTSGQEIISFADAEVKRICVEKWDTNKDGELSKDEAAAVKELGVGFYSNTSIITFEELQFFTGLSTIPNQAFYGCNHLSSIKLPNTITTINGLAFGNCNSLTSLTIPKTVNKIGLCAFQGCESLTSIDIPENISILEQSLFFNCTKLSKITIPSNISVIEDGVFQSCKSLTSVSLPSSVTEIGKYAFNGCTNLKEIKLPEGITKISENMFGGCSNLESVSLPSSVTEIGEWAFLDCSSLKSITIPKKVKSIGRQAFYWLDKLEKVTSLIENPFELYDVFSYKIKDIPLFVPKASADSYKSLTQWNNFKCILYADAPNYFKLKYYLDDELYKSYDVEYGASITKEPDPKKEGYSFTGWSNLPSTMPAEDVTVTGSFTINKYNLVYRVDGVDYKKYKVEYGSPITPEVEPSKEGYTFSGWQDLPSTMPAHDVVVKGVFNVNVYTVTYMIDGIEYRTQKVNYGDKIVPPDAPSKAGYTFEWINVPKTMPAYDIVIEGNYITGITNVDMQDSIIMIHNLKGNKVSTLSKGVNIIRFRDGKIQKRIVK